MTLKELLASIPRPRQALTLEAIDETIRQHAVLRFQLSSSRSDESDSPATGGR